MQNAIGGFARGPVMAWRAVAFFGAVTIAGSAFAAPFCIRDQAMTPQCIYADPASCEKEAQRLNAVCTINPREVTLPRGVGRYCMVTSALAALCMYTDRESCSLDAARHKGVCTDKPGIVPTGAPDPYSPTGGR